LTLAIRARRNKKKRGPDFQDLTHRIAIMASEALRKDERRKKR
jgi:hypothetical protein